MTASPTGFGDQEPRPAGALSRLDRCALVLQEHASGNLPELEAFVALRKVRPDVRPSILNGYLRRARSLASKSTR